MIRVGVIDSGFIADELCSMSFYNDGTFTQNDHTHVCNHGEVIASMIRQERCQLYSAKVFHTSLRTTPLQVANALHFLMEQRVDLIHMSLGLRTDHPMIYQACKAYIARGGVIVASTPTQGSDTVYPAAYEGVIKVCADGRCQGKEVSFLPGDPPRFGASPHSHSDEVRGSSVAAARVSGVIVSMLKEGIRGEDIMEILKQRSYR